MLYTQAFVYCKINMYTITLKGDKELNEALKKTPKLIDKACKQMITKATYMAHTEARKQAPVDKGILRGSIDKRVNKQGIDYVGRVGTDIKYAPYQEFGTGIYGKSGQRVRPRNASHLVFRNKKTGRIVKARSVKGVKGKFYMRKALAHVQDNVDKIYSLGRRIIKL